MTTELLKDSNGKTSTTRTYLYVWLVFIIILAVYSIYTGNDIGENVSKIIDTFTTVAILGAFGKMGAEALKKNV